MDMVQPGKYYVEQENEAHLVLMTEILSVALRPAAHTMTAPRTPLKAAQQEILTHYSKQGGPLIGCILPEFDICFTHFRSYCHKAVYMSVYIKHDGPLNTCLSLACRQV